MPAFGPNVGQAEWANVLIKLSQIWICVRIQLPSCNWKMLIQWYLIAQKKCHESKVASFDQVCGRVTGVKSWFITEKLRLML